MYIRVISLGVFTTAGTAVGCLVYKVVNDYTMDNRALEYAITRK
jgi:hypothetical protein